jgi:cell division protein FtsB
MDEIDILKKNVFDIQEQLQREYIKNKELREDNDKLNKEVNKLTKLLNILLGKAQ